MGLGRSEQRLLGQIERALHLSDPKLAAALASFTTDQAALDERIRRFL